MDSQLGTVHHLALPGLPFSRSHQNQNPQRMMALLDSPI